MKILIRKSGSRFIAEPSTSGACRIGVGSTMDAAMGDFLRGYQKELGVEIILDDSVQKTEVERQRRALSSR